jgi:serine protease AprX
MTQSIAAVDRMRWLSALVASLLLTAMVSLALSVNRAPAAPSASGSVASGALTGGSDAVLDPRIATLAAAHPGTTVEAIVQFKAGVSGDRARRDSAGAHARVIADLHIINALGLRVSAADARALAVNPDVHAVSLNTVIRPQGLGGDHRFHLDKNIVNGRALSSDNTYDQTLNATGLWRSGLTGTGVGVAVVDTGVDGALPDFNSADGRHSRVIGTAVANPGATTVNDTYGHGTDVAGIIAGNGENRDRSDPLYGQYVGVAPNANLVAIKVADDAGRATVLDVIGGIQFAIDHKSDYNIRIINLSLDSVTPQSYKTDPLDAAAESAWMHGIVVVAAAGNRGASATAVQFAPANDPYVITVGGVDEHGTANTADDTIASWSSRGITQDGFQKPDVYAPGAHIVSILAPHSAFASACAACIVDGQYIRTSGTSMAAPMISGLVADVLQAHPGWTPNQVKGAVTSQAVTTGAAVQEPSALKVGLLPNAPPANAGLVPSTLITGPAGQVNYGFGSWSFSSWSVAKGALSAGFALSSWSCAQCTGGQTAVDPSLSSWTLGSWSTVGMH